MALLGGTIETPRDLYVHKLGAALKMEKTILDMLPQLEECAKDSQLKQSLRQHYDVNRPARQSKGWRRRAKRPEDGR